QLLVPDLGLLRQLVIQHPAPDRGPTEDGQRPRPAEDHDVLCAVEPAQAGNVARSVEARVLTRGLRRLHGPPGPGAARDGPEQQLRTVAMPGQRPRAPRHDRLRGRADRELSSERDVRAHEPGGSTGSSSGIGSTGAGPGSGMGIWGSGSGTVAGSISMIRLGRPIFTARPPCMRRGTDAPPFTDERTGPPPNSRPPKVPIRPERAGRSRWVR